jgi:hypothetical protein
MGKMKNDSSNGMAFENRLGCETRNYLGQMNCCEYKRLEVLAN